MLQLIFPALTLLTLSTSAQSTSSSLATSLGFTTPPSTLSFPSNSALSTYSNTTNNATARYIRSEWDVYHERIQWGSGGLQFVRDPEVEEDGLVLKVDYPEGSYSKATGGTQFYSQPLNGTSTPSALFTYNLYLPSDFNYVNGGKLPGLRGGTSVNDCSGGDQADGKSCFSTRIMWRAGGVGEVYAYIPITDTLCSQTGVICNSDYGTSLGRGSFSFQRGAWNEIALFVQLNEPVTVANGVIELYYNGVKAISFSNLVLRTSESLSDVGGIYFSTFFGGDDAATYATPTDQSLYYKDLMLFGKAEAANGTGTGYKLVGAARRGKRVGSGVGVGLVGVVGAVVMMMMII